MPPNENHKTAGPRNLRAYFPLLELQKNGLCEQCANAAANAAPGVL
jgi:hypothetical protein